MSNPWKSIPRCEEKESVNGKRVDSEHPYGLYWAVGYDNSYLLLMTYNGKASPLRLPKLKGLEIFSQENSSPEKSQIFLKLIDPKYQDIFYRLCCDIIAATKNAQSNDEAVTIFVARTWRWHQFLKGERTKALSPEEQKGLIGELSVLKEFLLPLLNPRDAVNAWTGPSGSPKDFEIGRLAIESKVRRGAAKPFVAISSEHQLDTSSIECLLYVLEVFTAPEKACDGFTVSQLASELKQSLAEKDPVSAEQFEALLYEYGLNIDDDYSDYIWQIGKHYFFDIKEGFPRITSDKLLPGVVNVKYSISLSECSGYRVSDDTANAQIKEARNGINA